MADKGLDSERREAMRQMLTRLRDEIYTRITELRKEQEQESEPGAADSIEAARATADIETHASLIDMAENRLRLFDEALSRVDNGTYGICADCGAHIALERLSAVPFALYCVPCQKKPGHAGAARPGEGTMIPPYDHQWTVPEEMREPTEYRVSTNVVRRGVSAQTIATKTGGRKGKISQPRSPRPRKK